MRVLERSKAEICRLEALRLLQNTVEGSVLRAAQDEAARAAAKQEARHLRVLDHLDSRLSGTASRLTGTVR